MRIPARFGLIFGFTGLIIAFSSLIIISSSYTSRLALSKHARTIMENIASYTIDKSQEHLEPARKAARLTRGLSQNDIVSSRNVNSMVAYFYEQLYLYPQFSGIYFGSATGEFYMASRYNQLEQGGFYTKQIKFPDGNRVVEKVYKSSEGHLIRRELDPNDNYDPRKRPWFKSAKLRNNLIWTDPYVFYTSKKPGITTANPVYDPLGKFLGVIGVDIEIDQLSTFISQLNVSEHGKAFILNHDGDLIAYPDMAKLKQRDHADGTRLTKIIELDDPVAREAFLSLGLPHDQLYLDAPVFTSFDMDGERYNAMFAPFSDSQWPWVIGIYMPEDDYLATIKSNRTVNILIALVAVIIALFIGLVVARKLNAARMMAEDAAVAKSQFLARMSHEIRTPMNAILGAGELLAETPLNSDQKRYISIYQSAGEHLRDLISDVLDISKIESGRFRLETMPFNLSTTVKRTCDVFALEARDKGLALEWRIATGTPDHLIGDPTALRQILVNLIGNAVKFTPAGSIRVTVDAINRRSQTDVPDWVTIEFSVEDTGIGIPEKMQASVFDRFMQADGTTSRTYGGTGLGLTICRSLTALMGGEISLESHPGEGSTFTFTAQFQVDPHFGAAVEDRSPSRHVKKGTSPIKRILLVEDDERNRLLFTMFLKDVPHEFDSVPSGEDAIAAHFNDPYDLILMDIEMAGLDGHDTTEAIMEREKQEGLPPTPIVAVTAHAINEAKERCLKSGCVGYLAKPVTKSTLRRVIEQYLGITIDKEGQET